MPAFRLRVSARPRSDVDSRRRRRAWSAGVLALVLLGTYDAIPGGPANAEPAAERRAPACPGESPTETTALRDARECGGEVRITAQTTEYDQGVAQPDGGVRWEHRYRPVRVRRDGGWTPVDTTLTRSADGTVRPVATAAGLVFSGGGPGPMVSVTEDGAALTLGSPVGDLPEPVLDGDVATYPEVLPGVDLQLKADVDGYAQVLVVKDRAAAANPKLARLQFPMDTAGLDVSADQAGNLRAAGPDGKLRFTGNAPVMWDAPAQAAATGEKTGRSGRVRTMAATVSRTSLSVAPDRAMLADPSTVYPVYLDPGVTAARSNWTKVDYGNPNTSYWNASGDAPVGTANNGTNRYRSFFDLDVGSTPIAGKYISAATFAITETHSWSCIARPVELWSTTYAGSAATWNNQPTWSTLQSTLTVANGSTLCTTNPPDLALRFTATNIVRAAASGKWVDVSVGLRTPNETDNANYKLFNNNPTMQITYFPYEPAAGCPGGTAVAGDYNGDHVVDTVIGSSKATVDGLGSAGLVNVVDGASGAVTTLREGGTGVPVAAASSDEFGKAVTSLDANQDGCSDLVVSAPFADVGGVADAGRAFLVFGAAAGLGTGPATIVLEQGRALEQSRGTVPDAPEAGDWFGFSLAGGMTAAGEPFLVIGVPGEDIGSAVDAGKVHYLRGSVNIAFDESQVGAGALENDDRLGYAVAATGYQFAASQVGESIGSAAFAGSVCVYNHTVTNNLPGLIKCVYQGASGVASDTAEPGDQFGKSIAMVPYRPVGAAAGVADSLLVVGVPGEDTLVVPDTGQVQQFLVTATSVTELAMLNQNSTGMNNDNAAGDYFGERVVAVNLNPAAEASASTVLVAVGTPGEDRGSLDTGAVHVFAGGTAAFPSDTELWRRTGSLPQAPIRQELIGAWLGGNGQSLLVGSPYGTQTAYALSWSSLAAGSAVPTATYQAGTGSFPAAFSFGIALG